MNALEELRNMADLQECGRAFVEIGKLRNLADRIEAEWMELPRDKDGEVIHVGDSITAGENTARVVRITLDSHDRWSLTCDNQAFYIPGDVRLTDVDTWERIEADAKIQICCAYFKQNRDGKYIECDRCPASKTDYVKCDDLVKLDLVRRCKALAGVDDD